MFKQRWGGEGGGACARMHDTNLDPDLRWDPHVVKPAALRLLLLLLLLLNTCLSE